MITCTTCNGGRILTIQTPNMQGPSNNRYQSNITPFVTRSYQCHDCHGTGRIDCLRCLDTGLIETSDVYGGHDSTSPMQCTCSTAKAQAARLRVRDDAERELAHAEPF